MKFPRFYNPFARIRALEAEVAYQRDIRERVRNSWCASYNALSQSFDAVLLDLDGHAQANEAFMAEREDFKANIALRDAVGVQLVSCLMAAEQVITANDSTIELANQATEELAAEVLELRGAAQQQAAETLEVVSFVKACEDALGVAGITIRDGENGPRVTVDTTKIITALRLDLIDSATSEPVAA